MSHRLHCIVMASVCAAYSALSSAQGVERPNWSLNDTWTYKVIDVTGQLDGNGRFPSTAKFTIVDVRPNRYRAEVSSVAEYGERATTNAVWGFSRNLNGYWRESANLPWTELEFLHWPLVVGDGWEFTHPMPDGTKFEWRVKVSGLEDVSVPAGRFKAIVVNAEGQAGAHYQQVRTIWYAPDAKAIVKLEWRGFWQNHALAGTTRELATFTLQPVTAAPSQ